MPEERRISRHLLAIQRPAGGITVRYLCNVLNSDDARRPRPLPKRVWRKRPRRAVPQELIGGGTNTVFVLEPIDITPYLPAD